ncbi:unnamed protein product, partial [Mesorhabditis spiculigera]
MGLDWILRAIVIVMSFLSAAFDLVTYLRVRQQMRITHGSKAQAKGDGANRPDIRLAKQIIVNQAMNALLAVPTVYFYCLEFVGAPTLNPVLRRSMLMQSLYYEIGTVYLPILANVVTG